MGAFVWSPQESKRALARPAEGPDTEANPAVCPASGWEDRRSKQACSEIAIALRAAQRSIGSAAIAVTIRFAHPAKPEDLERKRVAAP